MKRSQKIANATSLPSSVDSSSERSGLASLAALSILAGAASGLVGACFRYLLLRGDELRNALVDWAGDYQVLGMLVVVATAAGATALAAWLVRRFAPEASGSGIPHVEAVLRQRVAPAPLIALPVKFVGGLLAIGAGLALGREGPTVQMGASAAHWVAQQFRRNAEDARILLAAGAGAGLATAFNAPIAGSVFVLEELLRRFDTRITIATLGASAAAIGVSRLVLGDAPDFAFHPLPSPAVGSTWLYLVMGLLIGGLGVAYNRSILAALTLADRMKRVPVEARAGAIGVVVGLCAWYAPFWVGGGDNITQLTLDGGMPLALLAGAFAFRFALSAVSYAAGTPGGLFAPMLVLGSQAGLIYGTLATRWFPAAGGDPTAFAVTGMAAFFTATVRAPVTGIILVIELTASDTQLLSMLAACFTAMLIPTLVSSPPIYDSLGKRP